MNNQQILEHLDEIWTFGHDPTDEEREAIRAAMDIVEKYSKIGEWIPCSERLPEETGYYLCTMRSNEVMICKYGWNSPKTKKDFFRNYCASNVIAWKPLPAPYEVKSDE